MDHLEGDELHLRLRGRARPGRRDSQAFHGFPSPAGPSPQDLSSRNPDGDFAGAAPRSTILGARGALHAAPDRWRDRVRRPAGDLEDRRCLGPPPDHGLRAATNAGRRDCRDQGEISRRSRPARQVPMSDPGRPSRGDRPRSRGRDRLVLADRMAGPCSGLGDLRQFQDRDPGRHVLDPERARLRSSLPPYLPSRPLPGDRGPGHPEIPGIPIHLRRRDPELGLLSLERHEGDGLPSRPFTSRSRPTKNPSIWSSPRPSTASASAAPTGARPRSP